MGAIIKVNFGKVEGQALWFKGTVVSYTAGFTSISHNPKPHFTPPSLAVFRVSSLSDRPTDHRWMSRMKPPHARVEVALYLV